MTSVETKPSPVPRDTGESGEEREATPPPRRRRTVLRRILAAVVVFCVLAAGGVFAWLRISQASTMDNARTSALDAGKRYAIAIATYDYRNPTANLDEVVSHSTDKFAADYRNASQSLTELIKQYQATSQGTVLDAAVTASDETHAVVLAFVDQTITNTSLKDPRVDRSRMRLHLVKSGDDWRLDEINLL